MVFIISPRGGNWTVRLFAPAKHFDGLEAAAVRAFFDLDWRVTGVGFPSNDE
jgi:hypothetical protein